MPKKLHVQDFREGAQGTTTMVHWDSGNPLEPTVMDHKLGGRNRRERATSAEKPDRMESKNGIG